MLSAYFDLLACPTCQSALQSLGDTVRCPHCRVTYACLPDTDCLVLERAGTTNEPADARARKAHVHQRFATIDRTLSAVGHGEAATFLNLGYVANDAPRRAARGPAGPVLNRFSTALLFEVVGDCRLDGRSIVDLGCGRGGNLALLHQYYAPRTLLGVDLSSANIASCRRRHRIDRGGFIVGDVEHLPLRGGGVDVVLNIESSHYYPDIERFFAEVGRVLVRGGAFLYADVLPAATFARARRCLEQHGCRIERDEDITANVLLSCEAVARLRAVPRYSRLYEMFDVIPGSPLFEALRAGDQRYRILSARKI